MNQARHNRLGIVALLAAALACQDRNDQPDASRPESCFLELNRGSPGRLKLSQPVPCSEPVSRYRLQEPLSQQDRPELIEYLDPDGSSRLSYRVSYDRQGRPATEERLYRLKPAAYKMYGGRTKVEFSGRAPGKWEVVRILTELDSLGRPLKTRKFVGADLQYSVISEYRQNRLHTQSTYDGTNRLQNRISYTEKDGQTIERMLDSTGKVLMERVVVRKEPGEEQALDTSGQPPVHSPIPSD